MDYDKAVHNTVMFGLTKMFDAMIEAEQQPVVVTRSRDGWAGYQAGRRVTRFFFSESGARAAADAWMEA